MKYLVVFFGVFLLTASCGKIEQTTGTGVGELRQLTPAAVSANDAVVYDQICQGLTIKQQKLNSSQPNLAFDVQSKDCDGNNSVFETQQVTVVKLDNTFQIKLRSSSSPFVFPKVETTADGIFSVVCGKTQLQLPFMLANGDAMWVRSGGECPGASGEVCVTVETGSKDPNSAYYRVHTREFVRFNVLLNNGKHGYFTYRRRLSESVCSGGKYAEDIVTWR